MNLEIIWDVFLETLVQHSAIQSARKQNYSGIPFLYVEINEETTQKDLEQLLKTASAQVMKGKRLHVETIFVRQESSLYVYRHRFYVPQEKMFCCGNICVDCIRLK
ncbi:hypothetical protein JOC85_000252 [Bacillus mesophilus]|uniref:Uncharacterized protein n=1 Tax=Bacillus mesophilus TaxID=1808955 RepID=A0A6M0Q5H3_9BACI|nr:hypothetical protein [Bacillus mesophilus]MBM7659485.1 hypothetical protein [Bacillus mesophilus]NEY70358.1 hypothetical protein [Bacillus mesophilus]